MVTAIVFVKADVACIPQVGEAIAVPFILLARREHAPSDPIAADVQEPA